MLVQQESLPLSACSDFYDFIVPKDNLTRKIHYKENKLGVKC